MAPPPKRRNAIDVTDGIESPEPSRQPPKRSFNELEDGNIAGSSRGGPSAASFQVQPEIVEFFTFPKNIEKKWVAEKHLGGPDPEAEIRHENKPVRALSGFLVFDAPESVGLYDKSHRLVQLDAEVTDNAMARWAVGECHPADQLDEDLGQEDEGGAPVILMDVELCPMDYTEDNAPVYIKTSLAYYELRAPSKQYLLLWERFIAPRRITRGIIAHVQNPRYESLTATVQEQQAVIPLIFEALADDRLARVREADFIKALLRNHPHTYIPHPRSFSRPSRRATIGDPDVYLLLPEYQLQTHVTPMVERFSRGLFDERLHLVGPKPVLESEREIKKHADAVQRMLQYMALNAQQTTGQRQRLSYSDERGRYRRKARVGNKDFSVDDFVLVPRGSYDNIPEPTMDLDHPGYDALPRLFWFARIRYFDTSHDRVHLQWLQHGSESLLSDFARPQELFYTGLCDDWPIALLVDKITVFTAFQPKVMNSFFVQSIYNAEDASITEVNTEKMEAFSQNKIPHNCMECHDWAEREQKQQVRPVRDDPASDIANGVSHKDHKYHIHEFILYKNKKEDGPANIGYIQDIRRTTGPWPDVKFIVRVVVRISELTQKDPNNFEPERHVVLTDERAIIPVSHVIRPIHVFALSFFQGEDELIKWTRYSPYNFYCTYHLPSQTPAERLRRWATRTEVDADTFFVCEFCPSEMYAAAEEEAEFEEDESSEEYHFLDVFGGTGAFSLGIMEGLGLGGPTHFVEITPSAALTAKKNNPNLAVYNTDANEALNYFVRSEELVDKSKVKVPMQNYDPDVPVPPPIPGGKNSKMRVICAGLPCQSHSALNMFRKADDKKSNLILTMLSYVEFFRPTYFIMENVPGFLRYNLKATQVSQHKVEGGIDLGGLALMYRTLLELGYQIRCGLLQAGCYGTPQDRVRFFLVAAFRGHTLPELPQPTHDFPTKKLGIKLPYGYRSHWETVSTHKRHLYPIDVARGKAAHHAVTIEDAIGDLPRWDWQHPSPRKATLSVRKLLEERERRQIPTFKPDRKESHCGIEDEDYADDPRTSYQKRARERPTENLQHFTRCLLPKVVERTVCIPVDPRADYRSLPAEQRDQFQMSHTASAVGKKSFRSSMYGRLDPAGFFPTTVTNIHPTAKQSRVLHPTDLRMVSVRELARSQGFPDWFVFEARTSNVITMHRQIGNAVPLPIGRALGAELRKARMKDWKRRRLRGVSDAEMVVDPRGR